MKIEKPAKYAFLHSFGMTVLSIIILVISKWPPTFLKVTISFFFLFLAYFFIIYVCAKKDKD